MSNANEPAFPEVKTEPRYDRHRGEYSDTYSTGGLTKREHAAILLRVPKSGDDEIDAMIRAANRRDIAAQAIQGLIASNDQEAGDRITELPEYAATIADALLAELERTA